MAEPSVQGSDPIPRWTLPDVNVTAEPPPPLPPPSAGAGTGTVPTPSLPGQYFDPYVTNPAGAPGGVTPGFGLDFLNWAGNALYGMGPQQLDDVMSGRAQPGTPEAESAARQAATNVAGLGTATSFGLGEEAAGATLGMSRSRRPLHDDMLPPNERAVVGGNQPPEATPVEPTGFQAYQQVLPAGPITERYPVLGGRLEEMEAQNPPPMPAGYENRPESYINLPRMLLRSMRQGYERRFGETMPLQVENALSDVFAARANGGHLDEATATYRYLREVEFAHGGPTPNMDEVLRQVITRREVYAARQREEEAIRSRLEANDQNRRNVGALRDAQFNEERRQEAQAAGISISEAIRRHEQRNKIRPKIPPRSSEAQPPVGSLTLTPVDEYELRHSRSGTTEKIFNVNDPGGNRLAHLRTMRINSRKHGGPIVHINWVGVDDTGEFFHRIGHRNVRALMKGLKEHYPGTLGVSGHRIGGARKYSGTLGEAFIPWHGGVMIPWDQIDQMTDEQLQEAFGA
jgi:hypothetical protein